MAAANEEYSCKMYDPTYFRYCGIGGALAAGLTHLWVTPLDLVKCRLQVDHEKYQSIPKGFGVSYAEGGMRNLIKGWLPTWIGYSMQGSIKYGGYEYFKHQLNLLVGEEEFYKHRTALFLLASAGAEFCADIALAPFEAMKVRMQTTPCYTSSMTTAFLHMKNTEGWGVFYRGLPPLWARQIPYTMSKFASFERTVEYFYAHVVPKPRDQCTKGEQLMVTFAAGYIAGVLCAIVSHPADTLVSKMNKEPGSSMGSIVSEVGFWGMWRGLTARIIMIGTLTALQWFIYDAWKVYARMPRPPPLTMPESLKKQGYKE